MMIFKKCLMNQVVKTTKHAYNFTERNSPSQLKVILSLLLDSAAQNLLHLSAFGQLIHQFIQIPYLL